MFQHINKRATLHGSKKTTLDISLIHTKTFIVSYLDHAVTVGIGDVRLQASEQSSVVMFEVKILESKFGVFNSDLINHKDVINTHLCNLSCFFLQKKPFRNKNHKTIMKYDKSNLSVLFWHHVEMWLFITSNWWLRHLVVIIIIELHIFNFIGNLKSTQKIYLDSWDLCVKGYWHWTEQKYGYFLNDKLKWVL